ncbi:Crp/Fnr family transcriptional regulator [Pedobacter sp. SYP-B3415]|uniref:Crp/Fnr family transcriptional regulator n=1 Tax=Pedobacter sp. SYP-B3415 TaxID=2496641 RepID=UPI00101CF093|nr:Crp/Fnr family transcriptional regulator [Pedobacter sp. SYP-B3415]
MDRFERWSAQYGISLADYEMLTANLKQCSFKRGEDIIVPGQIPGRLFFVRTGVQVGCYETAEKNHILAFSYFPGILAVPGAFTFQAPSLYYWRSLTDSILDYISFTDLTSLFDRNQQIERFFRKMTEDALAGMISRHIELQAMTIAERYRTFCSRSPHLLQLVPHKYIASYLGIDPTNFSKLFNSIKI